MADTRDMKPLAADIRLRLARMSVLVEDSDLWVAEEWPEASQLASMLKAAEASLEKLHAHGLRMSRAALTGEVA